MAAPKLIIGPIQNLHDARYAAAVGIDYLVFNAQGPHAHSLAEVIQMRDWLSGPQIIVRFGEEGEGEIQQWVEQLSPVAIILPEGASAPAGILVLRAGQSDLGLPSSLKAEAGDDPLANVQVLDDPKDLGQHSQQPTAWWLGSFSLLPDGLLDYEACDAFLQAQSLAT